MRTLLLVTAAAAALLATPALAQDARIAEIRQTGENGTATVSQIANEDSHVYLTQLGENETATIRANSEGAHAGIYQTGSYASGKIAQSRSTRGANILLEQYGSAQATITQTGYTDDDSRGLSANVYQYSIGTVSMKQDGVHQFGRIVQDVGADVANGAPTVDLQQTGQYNRAELTQTHGGADSNITVTQGFGNGLADAPTQLAYGNGLSVTQSGGDRQSVYAHQDNNGATGTINQSGSDNLIDTTQGNNSAMTLWQIGTGLYANVFQAQNATADLKQTGWNNTLTLSQDGGTLGLSVVQARIVQGGTNNRLTVSQSGAGGLF